MLKDEIKNVIIKRDRESQYKQRNADIVNEYFGIDYIGKATLDSVGTKHGMTRERVRQIVKSYFVDVVREKDLPSARIITEEFNSRLFWTVADFENSISDDIGGKMNIVGVVNFLNLMGYVEDVNVYQNDLSGKAVVNEICEDDIIMSKMNYNKVKPFYTQLLRYPGILGLTTITSALNRVKKIPDNTIRNTLVELLKLNNNCCVINKNEDWYILENRDNVIINSIEKIANVTKNLPLNILCNVVYDCINKRSSNYPQPDEKTVEDYLKISKYIEYKNENVAIKVEPGRTNQLDDDILVAYKRNNTECFDYPTLCSELNNIKMQRDKNGGGYTEAYLKKVYSCPFIYTDRSEGRSNYKLYFIKHFSKENETNNGYEKDVMEIDETIDKDKKRIELEYDLELIDEINSQPLSKDIFEYTGKPKEKSNEETVVTHGVFKRSRTTALNALAHANYACENHDCKHELFVTRAQGRPYTEPHHLVPLAYSDRFEYSLDVEENIVSLCSSCHNQLHYGKEYESILRSLFEMRVELLKTKKINITYEQLLEFYR